MSFAWIQHHSSHFETQLHLSTALVHSPLITLRVYPYFTALPAKIIRGRPGSVRVQYTYMASLTTCVT